MQQAPALQGPGYQMGGYGEQSFVQTPVAPAFDEAAFEQAFAQAEQEAQQDTRGVAAEQSLYDRPGELDPLLMRIRETRPGV
jgi:hypothetical protein